MIIKGTPIAIGAESTISRVELWNRSYALKHRPSKPYLLPEIDKMLRTSRTNRECKSLTIARTLGVPTPAVHSVDLTHCTILMDLIEGKQLKEVANTTSETRLKGYCIQFGQIIAKLHSGGMVHGDPTTSNLIVSPKDRIWMIDFGLSELNATVEMKGVDLHLIRRAFETTHWDLQEEMLKNTINGYTKIIGDESEQILARMEEIRERGRYH